KVKEAYHLPFVRCANVNLEQKVERVAILGGSGEKYYKKALEKEADIYITGDISYHGAQDMIRDGLPFIDPGQHLSQSISFEPSERIIAAYSYRKLPKEDTFVFITRNGNIKQTKISDFAPKRS